MARVLWTQKEDIGPPARIGHAMVYDLARQRVTLFGGDSLNGTLHRDTWEWDGENWTQVQDIGPSGRASHAMAHDSARGRTVLFGGRPQAGALGDTWEWDGESWTQVADSGPLSRFDHAMTFDSARGRVVLFGGDDGNGAFFNDTWEWDGTDWVQQEDTGPSARSGAAMAFDATRARTVLFGGASGAAGLGDTWEWDGTAWTQETDFGPDPCTRAAMAFNGSGIALYGGIANIAPNANAALFGITWDWNGQHWTARQDMGPGPRVGHTLAFDSTRSRIVLFGGVSVAPSAADAPQNVRGDTWEQIRAATTGPIVELASLEITPDPVPQGTEATFTVTLVSPAPAPVTVELLVDGSPEPFALIEIFPPETTGSTQLLIPPGTEPGPIPIIARVGASQVSATLTITI
jgi:hypothetical protein